MTEPLSLPVFRKISRIVDGMGLRAYVIGGYVRDYYLCRPCTDIDVVVVGSGIDVAEALARETGSNVTVFKTFGTAMLRKEGMEVEFVGARKESYSRDSRKPVVEAGTLRDDQLRRDFTINALAWSLNGDTFGELEDPFGGMEDLREHIIRAPCDPDITFSDRMTLKLGDHTFQIFHTPGHSPEQSSVYVPQERCVFVGDIIFNACQIWLHSVDFDALFHSLDWLQSLDVDYIIPGHGPVKGKECIVENKQFLYAWLAAVGEGIEKGWSKEECVERISFADRCLMDIGQPECMEYVQTNNVRKCYDYLMRKAEL